MPLLRCTINRAGRKQARRSQDPTSQQSGARSVNNEQQDAAPSSTSYPVDGDDIIAGTCTQATTFPYAEKYVGACPGLRVWHIGHSPAKPTSVWFRWTTNSCPFGHFARVGTALSAIRESRHGIIRPHRIRFGLPLASTADSCVRARQQAPSPQGVPSKRLNKP
jgi:hypothetical protein